MGNIIAKNFIYYIVQNLFRFIKHLFLYLKKILHRFCGFDISHTRVQPCCAPIPFSYSFSFKISNRVLILLLLQRHISGVCALPVIKVP